MQRSSYPSDLITMFVLNQGKTDCHLPPDSRIHYTFRNTSEQKMWPTGKARNELLGNATGDVIVVMDDDDLYGAGYIDFMLRHLYAKPRRLLINLSRYLGMQVQADGNARFQTGTMGTGIGATFVFKRSVFEHRAATELQCLYANVTGEDDNALWSCVGNTHDADKAVHGGFAVAQADPYNASTSTLYIKTAWALSTTMEVFKNPWQTAGMGFTKHRKNVKIADYSHAVSQKLTGNRKHRYMERVAENMAAMDVLLSSDRGIGELLHGMKDACARAHDNIDFHCQTNS
jgi:hypothetical protein